MENTRFKFRAWDVGNKRYSGSDDWLPLVDKDGDLCFNSKHDDILEYPPEQSYFVIEQCTGLKDKNGNLIYEGDIVKAVTNTYKVIWDRYRWAIKDSQGYIFSEYINDLLYDCEIIGNIHEQKESDND